MTDPEIAALVDRLRQRASLLRLFVREFGSFKDWEMGRSAETMEQAASALACAAGPPPCGQCLKCVKEENERLKAHTRVDLSDAGRDRIYRGAATE